MPPQLREPNNNNYSTSINHRNMMNQSNDNDDQSETTEYNNSNQVNGGGGGGAMRRVVSEAFISVQPDDANTKREPYRLRKSSLIGYVLCLHIYIYKYFVFVSFLRCC